jgi:hypothetical protein
MGIAVRPAKRERRNHLMPSFLARQIDPTGKSALATKTRPALVQKIFSFLRRANQFYQLAPSHPPRGALAIVTNAGWDAVDAAASARKVIAGRAKLVSDKRRARRTALIAYGKTVWS